MDIFTLLNGMKLVMTGTDFRFNKIVWKHLCVSFEIYVRFAVKLNIIKMKVFHKYFRGNVNAFI